MENKFPPDVLTHDEKKAAEAAFAGRPFNLKWSDRARAVYDGIVKVLPTPPNSTDESSSLSDERTDRMESVTGKPSSEDEHTALAMDPQASLQKETAPVTIPFKHAIASGALIDVTATAQQLGLTFPITVTQPLWEVGIAPTNTIGEEEKLRRLRDVLMAFRLRLASQPTVSPLIDFPALLAFPPNAVPQPIPLFALIQPDEQNRTMVTLLLPNEVAASIIPLN
ncbi:hypothetical protein [Petrachloros mirabilis]